jgi:hypothetical protein
MPLAWTWTSTAVPTIGNSRSGPISGQAIRAHAVDSRLRVDVLP